MVPVPQSITPLQARRALRAAGMLAAVVESIAAQNSYVLLSETWGGVAPVMPCPRNTRHQTYTSAGTTIRVTSTIRRAVHLLSAVDVCVVDNPG